MQDNTVASDSMVPSGTLLYHIISCVHLLITFLGVIAVYKPMNWTSTDVVNKIKFILGSGMLFSHSPTHTITYS